MGGLLIRLQEWWRTTDKTQRVATLGGVAVLVFMLVGVFMFASRPKYETLYSNLSDQDRGAIMAELEGQGVDAISEAGVIKVPVGMKDKLHAKLAVSGKQPRNGGSWGQGEFDKIPIGTTPSIERERLKTIAEGDIARTIEQLDGVASAHVQITLPAPAIFQSDDKPPTASVTIVESSPGTLTGENGRVIAMLVSNAVPKMDPQSVVVTNQQMRFLWNGAEQNTNSTSTASKKLELETQVSKAQQNSIQHVLDQTFGVGSTNVIARAEVDMDSLKTTTDATTPSDKPLDITTQDEKVAGTAPGGPGGKSGAGANIGAPSTGAGGAAGDKGTYDGKVKTASFGPNRVISETTKAVGTLKSLNINVVIDSNKNIDKAKVEEIIKGDLGNKLQVDANGVPLPNQPFAFKVTDVAFDKTASEDAKLAEDKAASAARMQQLISILPIVALLFVALLVVKQVGKFARTYLPAPAPIQTSESLMAMHDPMFHTADAPALESIANQLLDRIASEDGVNMPASALTGNMDDDVMEIERIKDKVHVPLEQLRKMASERPQIVAMLVKSMLLEERR